MTTTEALIRAGQAYMAAACSGNLAGAVDAMRAALAQQPAASVEPAEPLKGWKLNHAQKGPEDGMAEIGYLDPEDDHFSPIVTVDTGLYYQANQAMPLAVAILGALADAAPQPAPARVPLHEDALYLMADECETPAWGEWYSDLDALLRFARAIEAAHGVAAAPTAQQEPARAEGE